MSQVHTTCVLGKHLLECLLIETDRLSTGPTFKIPLVTSRLSAFLFCHLPPTHLLPCHIYLKYAKEIISRLFVLLLLFYLPRVTNDAPTIPSVSDNFRLLELSSTVSFLSSYFRPMTLSPFYHHWSFMCGVVFYLNQNF